MFEGLPRKVLARIDSHCDEIDVDAGQVLTHEGGASREAFVVASGDAEVRVGDEVVRQTEVGELIGDIGVLQRRARTATVTALTEMRLLVINGRDLDWLFEDEQLAARVRANLERHLAGPQPS
jgi:CRP-like cAMP-binding protein